MGWSISWNPEFRRDVRIKKEVTQLLDSKTIKAVERYAKITKQDSAEGLDVDHVIWLTDSRYLVRCWYDDDHYFILLEEVDLSDIAFLQFDGMKCEAYKSKSKDTDKPVQVEVKAENEYDVGVDR